MEIAIFSISRESLAVNMIELANSREFSSLGQDFGSWMR